MEEQDASQQSHDLFMPSAEGFRFLRKLAHGATSIVYLAEELGTGERVALKVLREQYAEEESARMRFAREHEIGRALHHPFVVQTLGCGVTREHLPFLVTEYLAGTSLAERLQREDRPSDGHVLRWLSQAALAITHAHRLGVIHRDIKPANIMLALAKGQLAKGRESEGCNDVDLSAKVFDFGASKVQLELGARLTGMDTTLGSPRYMSPEQVSGSRDIDPRADVFSFASVAYECLLGFPAFQHRALDRLVQSILQEEPLDPSAFRPELGSMVDAAFHAAWKKAKAARTSSPVLFMDAMVRAFGLEQDDTESVATMPPAQLEAALLRAARLRQQRSLLPVAASRLDDEDAWTDDSVARAGGHAGSWEEGQKARRGDAGVEEDLATTSASSTAGSSQRGGRLAGMFALLVMLLLTLGSAALFVRWAMRDGF